MGQACRSDHQRSGDREDVESGDDAVVDLDLSIQPGEIYAFLGPNGAGKTTTIRMLCGLLKPTSGTIRIGGFDLREDMDSVRKAIALVPDTPPLYEFLTGREYIGFVASLFIQARAA